jgi:hypothetical protein
MLCPIFPVRLDEVRIATKLVRCLFDFPTQLFPQNDKLPFQHFNAFV